jgi:hypothetical protein
MGTLRAVEIVEVDPALDHFREALLARVEHAEAEARRLRGIIARLTVQ